MRIINNKDAKITGTARNVTPSVPWQTLLRSEVDLNFVRPNVGSFSAIQPVHVNR